MHNICKVWGSNPNRQKKNLNHLKLGEFDNVLDKKFGALQTRSGCASISEINYNIEGNKIDFFF